MRTRPSVLVIAGVAALTLLGPAGGASGVHFASVSPLGGSGETGAADARLATMSGEEAGSSGVFNPTLGDGSGRITDPAELVALIDELLQPPPPPPPPPPSPDPTNPFDFVDPIDGRVISAFGQRDGRPHQGVDIKGVAQAPIRASMPGRVVQAGQGGTGYGLSVTIDHGLGITTLYAHLSSVSVRAGTEVAAGDQVGVQGQTGRATTPHLHYEVRIRGRAVNPAPYLVN